MKRAAVVLLGLVLILSLAWCTAETASQPDRQILFEETERLGNADRGGFGSTGAN